MEAKYRQALPLLQEKLSFEVNTITSLDMFYNDGDSRVMNSFFKLIFPRENHGVATVYIQEGAYWVSFGSLTEYESLAIHKWMDTLS